MERLNTETGRLRKLLKQHPANSNSQAEMAALAYPDRVGLRRTGDAPRWVLSGGTGAVMNDTDPLASSRLIVATDLDGDVREARIRQAIALSEAELRRLYSNRIEWQNICEWSKRDRKVITRRQERFGALVLSDQRWAEAPADVVAHAMLDGVRDLGLPWSGSARRLQARMTLLHDQRASIPDCSETYLMETLNDWLLPYLVGITTADQLKTLDLVAPLRARLDWDGTEILYRLAPSKFTTPMGRQVPIDYSTGAPEITVRLQEMFGVTRHPTIGPKRLPLKTTLLSPAGRPLQTTTDLPGFWTSSYADVHKDMRGRYPKHPWPEDPTRADPTLRTKPRGK